MYENNGLIYFDIIKVCYGLPQAGKLANDLLRTLLNNNGYYETATMPGIWRRKWRPIMFVLIDDDFGIKYMGDNHLHHLRTVLTKHYTITEDLEGEKIAGIDLKWNYTKSTPNAHVASPWRATFPTCSSIMATKLPPNLKFPCTATAK